MFCACMVLGVQHPMLEKTFEFFFHFSLISLSCRKKRPLSPVVFLAVPF